MPEREAAAKTWAVIVGIEQHEFGAKLPDAATHACRMAKWLKDRGVPNEQIKLFLSPLPENQAVADGLGFVVKPATQQEIYHAIEDELANVQAEACDTLFIYWGGHGSIAADGERVLYYSDAKENAWHCLDLNASLLALRGTRWQRFARQVLIVDACADYLAADGARLAKQQLTKSANLAATNQFALYAASAGETTSNESAKSFSRVVGDWMEANPVWPLNEELLANHVKTEFDTLRKHDKSVPTPLWVLRGRNDDDDDLHGDLASAFLHARLTGELIRQIRPLPITTEKWQTAFLQTARYLDRSPGKPASRDEMVHSLARVQPEKGKDLPEPVYEFIWRAAVANDHDDLRQWVENKIADGTKVAELKKRVEKESGPQNFHLMVELKPPSLHKRKNKKQPFAETLEWRLWDEAQSRSLPTPEGESKVLSTKGTREDAQKFVSDLVSKRLAQSRGFNSKASLAVEFFFELDHLLTEDVECWQHLGSNLGAIFPVAVRWLGRKKHLASWQTLSGKLCCDTSQQSCPTVRWLPDHKLKQVFHLAPHFVNDDDCRPLIGLRVPPKRDTTEFALLEAALQCGAPFAFWPRKPVADNETFQTTLETRAEQKPLDQFPAGLRELRCEALGEPEHPAANLTLLWDDTRRNPYASGGFVPTE